MENSVNIEQQNQKISMVLDKKEREEFLKGCRFCPMCQVIDRVGSIVCRESYTPRGRAVILEAAEKGLIEWDDTVADIIYTALNDGLAREWCVSNYDYEELIIDARARIFKRGKAPISVVRFLESFRGNPKKIASPAEILSKTHTRLTPSADVLLFCGCKARESNHSVITAMGRLFNHVGVKFRVLDNEPCCGWPFYQLGHFEGAKEFSVNISKAIREAGVSTVAVLDADCFRMLTTRNTRFGGNLYGINIVNAISLIWEWVQKGLLKVTHPIADSVTYHDPCAYARYCEDTDTPRKMLKNISSGDLKEMATNRKMANCCGAGGMMYVHRPDIAEKVALLRFQEAKATSASLLVTGCPGCDVALASIKATHEEGGPKIMNLIELVAMAAGTLE